MQLHLQFQDKFWIQIFEEIANGELKVDNRIFNKIEKIENKEHDKRIKQDDERRKRSKAKETGNWYEPGRSDHPLELTHGW